MSDSPLPDDPDQDKVQRGQQKSRLDELTYKKIKADGTPDPTRLAQEDYDLAANFIKSTFPSTTVVQRDLEDTLKRKFLIGKVDKKKQMEKLKRKKSLGLKNKKSQQQSNLRPKKKLSKGEQIQAKRVPHKLLYSDFVQLNELWKGYIQETFNFVQGCPNEDRKITEFQDKLNRIDLHGARIRVVDGHCSSFVSLQGIIIKETKNTFVIVTRDNFTRVIPKASNTFEINIEGCDPATTTTSIGVLKIAGNSIITRPAERSSKKIKSFLDFVSPKLYRKKLLKML